MRARQAKVSFQFLKFMTEKGMHPFDGDLNPDLVKEFAKGNKYTRHWFTSDVNPDKQMDLLTGLMRVANPYFRFSSQIQVGVVMPPMELRRD